MATGAARRRNGASSTTGWSSGALAKEGGKASRRTRGPQPGEPEQKLPGKAAHFRTPFTSGYFVLGFFNRLLGLPSSLQPSATHE